MQEVQFLEPLSLHLHSNGFELLKKTTLMDFSVVGFVVLRHFYLYLTRNTYQILKNTCLAEVVSPRATQHFEILTKPLTKLLSIRTAVLASSKACK